MTGIEILESVQWYAITNIGTGPDDPHTVILRQDNINGTGQDNISTGQDNISIEIAIQNAYEDLQRMSTL